MSSSSYEVPSTQYLLIISSFLYVINIADALASRWIYAGLIGPMLVGIIYGSQRANILSPSFHFPIIGLHWASTRSIWSGSVIKLTPPLPPLLRVACGACNRLPCANRILYYFALFWIWVFQITGFATGTVLCSTSLGTTLTLLNPSLRQTRIGSCWWVQLLSTISQA